METVLIMIEYIQILSFYGLTHDLLVDVKIVKRMIESLEKHSHPAMIKAIAGTLYQYGNLGRFNEQFTTDNSIEIVLSIVILNQETLDKDIMIRLQETVRVVINNSTSKARFSIAQIGLEIAHELKVPYAGDTNAITNISGQFDQMT
jgi:hypothetical protein